MIGPLGPSRGRGPTLGKRRDASNAGVLDLRLAPVPGDRRTLVFRVFNFSCWEEFEEPRGPVSRR